MRRLRGDDGAYAILYAVLVVLLVGIASVVIDLGMLRNDRRQNRAAADAAAVAAAAKLGLSGANPYEACLAAVRYAQADLGITGANENPCFGKFKASPFNAATACAAGIPTTAVVPLPSGNRTLHFTWPVPNDSPLMLDPDHERHRGYDLPDQVASDGKGQDGGQCLRAGVAITQDRNTPFAAVWGDIDATRGTVSHSVGLAAPDDGPGDIAAPLVVLDEHSCDALLVTGGGSIIVKASAVINGVSTPGVIAVDSDADGTGEVACGGQKTAIDAESNPNHIWAVDGTAGPAYISSYAVSVGNISKAYDPASTANCTPGKSATEASLRTAPEAQLCPVPMAGARVGEEPWIVRYNCDDSIRSCPSSAASPLPSPRNYVDQWVAFATNTAPSSARATWGTTPGTHLIQGGACSHNAAGTVITGDTYVNCDRFEVAGGASISFMGRVIFRGDVDAAQGGCILFNDAVASHCVTPEPYQPPANRTADGGNVYIGGSISGNGNGFYSGGLIIKQVFIFVAGRVNINTTDPVYWTAPYGKALPAPYTGTCVPANLAQPATTAPTPACFDSLGLWAPTFGTDAPSDANRLRGGALLQVDGTLFMPKSYFTFAGQGANFQDRAQFVARRLEIAGGGELSMVPDASRSTLIPRGVGKLIR